MSGFVKLYGTILDSSIWGEPLSVRVVWITMLALADKDGIVAASSDGIARRANVPLKQTDNALEVLSSPDPRSKSDEHEGRRVERFDGGWQILNYAKYRELRTDKQIADAERIREKRERGEYDARGPVATESYDATRSTEADGDAEADAASKAVTTTTGADELEIVAALFPKPAAALPMLVGMTQGLGTGGMKAVPASVLHEAAVEIAASGGDVTPHRFKIFVQKILDRSNQSATGKRPVSTARKAGWLVAKEQADRDEARNRDPEIQAAVEQARTQNPAWWRQMQVEAKKADRWATPYAYDHLTRQQ